MDVFMLVATIIASIISVLVDIYLIIIYTHKDEPICNFVSIFCRIMILLSLIQVQLQPLFLLYDAMSSQVGGEDLSMLWIVIYFSILVNIAFLKPIASSLYQADQQDPCWKRFLWTFIQLIITMAVFGVLLGVGWLFLGVSYLPVNQITVPYQQLYIQDKEIGQTINITTIQMQASVPCFLIGIFCLLGYPILACCGACGMTALPISMIADFKNRPKWRRTNQARKITQKIKLQTVQLIKQADKVRRAINRVDYIDGWFDKRKKNNQLDLMLAQLEVKVERHRNVYQLFRLELNMAETNPIFFILKLIGGVFLIAVVVPIWWVQILLSHFVQESGILLDHFFITLETAGAGFVSIALVFLLTFYMILATLKGIFFISQSLPFIKIHPISQSRTWLNSFLFQVSLAILASTATIHLLVTTFPQFLRSGDIAVIMGQILDGMLFIGVFMRNQVFIYIFLIVTVLGLIWSIFRLCCLNRKTQAQNKIQQLRTKLFKKQDKNKQVSIQMTMMNLQQKSNELPPTYRTPKKQTMEKAEKTNKKSKKKKIKLQAV